MNFFYLLAWLLPLVFGAGVIASLQRLPRSPHAWATTLGCGTLLGLLLIATGVGVLGNVEISHVVPLLGSIVAIVSAMLWFAVWRRRKEGDLRPMFAARRFGWLSWLLLALLLAHAWLMSIEVLLRPPYPWDAWAIWLLKPKAWVLDGRIGDYVDYATWLADSTGRLRTASAWNYPELIANLAVWFAAAWGEWNAIAVDVAWLALWVALLVGSYGQLRTLELARDRAMIAVYALGSLPLIDVHVALAGYADLWIATVLAFAGMNWLRWLCTRRRGDLIVAVAFALTLPAIKLEGWIWLGLFLGVAAYVHLPLRQRRFTQIAVPLMLIVGMLGYLLHWPIVGSAFERLGGVVDTGELFARAPAVIASTVIGMFAQYNWHLFWFAVILTLALRWRALIGSAELRSLAVFLALGSVFLFIVFVLTPAGRWAESYTAVNRLTLQIVPLMLLFTALLWREPLPAESSDMSAPQSAASLP